MDKKIYTGIIYFLFFFLLLQIYSDKNHGISGPVTSRHLYRTITKFLQKECWDGGKPHLPNGEVAGTTAS